MMKDECGRDCERLQMARCGVLYIYSAHIFS